MANALRLRSGTNKQGPIREQLTDQQFSCVCGLFDTLERVRKRLVAEKRLVINGTVQRSV